MNPWIRGGREELVREIADSLASAGEYVRRVDAGPTQHMVDLHWCAHRAGSQVGMKVSVTVVEPQVLGRRDHSEQVTMTVVPRRDEMRYRLP